MTTKVALTSVLILCLPAFVAAAHHAIEVRWIDQRLTVHAVDAPIATVMGRVRDVSGLEITGGTS